MDRRNIEYGKNVFGKKRIAAIIPSYKPTEATFTLIESLLSWYKTLEVVFVDDCTPIDSEQYQTIEKIKAFALQDNGLTYLRTPSNKLKAGALNFGLASLWSKSVKPHVVFTFDDDVFVTNETLYEMVGELYSKPKLGAVCSQTRVINKHVNLLTRLQALEYHSFTVTKIADNGFLQGPLVMQGMLTAFRMQAIHQVKGFTPGHLIEDYDITVRMKTKGWNVGIAKHAQAWTDVPENFSTLWKQRVRWGYGGLEVLREYGKHIHIVFQDVLGHSLFLLLMLLVIMSFLFTSSDSSYAWLPYAALTIAGLQFILSMIFNIVILLTYEEKDKWDWVIKLSVLPELIYCNTLSLVLLGSYMYFVYNHTIGSLARRFKFFGKIYHYGLKGFEKMGYSLVWQTKGQVIKEVSQ